MPSKAITEEKTADAVIETLLSRHSVRSYRKGHIIPDEVLKDILRNAGYAPSAWNLQHWKFMVVDSEADKEKLLPIAYNQKQIVDSSVTIAVLGDTEANRNADAVYGDGIPAEFRERIIGQINQAYDHQGPRFARDHAFLNASLAAMQLMVAAKARGYDSVPMSGFDAGRFVEEFKIPSRYVPVMLISIGLAAEPAKPTSRLPLEDILFQS